jgi:hypothetical protein
MKTEGQSDADGKRREDWPTLESDDKKTREHYEASGEADPAIKQNRYRHGAPSGEGTTRTAPI